MTTETKQQPTLGALRAATRCLIFCYLSDQECARIIDEETAAPELLEAAQGLLNCHTGASWQTQEVRNVAFRKLAAAVTKATGGE